MTTLLNALASISLLSAGFSVNRACGLIFHEPKMPDSAKKLIKH